MHPQVIVRHSHFRPGRAWPALVATLLVLLPPAASPAQSPAVEDVLAQARRHVENFVEQFSVVKCTEQVAQLKLGKNGRVEHKSESVFDYLAILQAANGDLTVNESRLQQLQGLSRQAVPLLVTNGFSTLLLVFHPAYEPSFDFDLLSDETLDGQRLRHVAFHHRRGTPSPAVLLLRGREYPLDLVGEAWMDPQSGAIVRIVAGLEAPLEDLGVRVFRSDVRYQPLRFKGQEDAYWLPATATIDVQTPRQHWRNTHRFTAYQRFAVHTTATVGGPE